MISRLNFRTQRWLLALICGRRHAKQPAKGPREMRRVLEADAIPAPVAECVPTQQSAGARNTKSDQVVAVSHPVYELECSAELATVHAACPRHVDLAQPFGVMLFDMSHCCLDRCVARCFLVDVSRQQRAKKPD